MKRFWQWLTGKSSAKKPAARPDLRQSGAYLRQTGSHAKPGSQAGEHALPQRQPEYVDINASLEGQIDENGPGKNVLIRNKYQREDTGTHDTLKILDDSLLDSNDEPGFDPYNTGQFDRSRNWDRRSRG